MSSEAIIADLARRVRDHPRILPRGAGTKPALSNPTSHSDFKAFHILDLTVLSGIVEYEPDEFTLTALAGTPLAEITEALSEHGQYMPFDPPLANHGATLGGTVAAGLSGSGRHRYGGLRDFLIGVRFLDGQGRLVRGGGKVVKNVAGFDLPKLMVGSLGRLGVLVELTLKVFPRPPARQTLCVLCENLEVALETMIRLNREDWGCEAVDLEPNGQIWLRFAGDLEALEAQASLLEQTLQQEIRRWPATLVDAVKPDSALSVSEPWPAWSDGSMDSGPTRADAASDLAWIKIPLTPRRILPLEAKFATVRPGHLPLTRRYSVGGHLLWLHWPVDELATLDLLLAEQRLSGLTLRPAGTTVVLGQPLANPFLERVRRALDPENRFLSFA